MFLDNNEFETMPIDIEDADEICFTDNSYLINSERSDDHNRIKRELYDLLVSITGRGSKWGTMTGVRPLNLAFTEYERCGNIDMAMDALRSKYLISDNKCDLLREILTYQLDNIEAPAQGSASVYIGIPFCPTRCVYCAFASYVAEEQDIEEYLEKLLIEIKTTGEAAKKRNIPVESVYIGGGTPTTLSTPQLKRLITTTTDAFSIEAGNIEFTVEAGRPDTIDRDKLETIRNSGARRISINPQSMDQQVLDNVYVDLKQEVIETEIELKTSVDNLRVWAVNPEGFYVGAIPTTYENGILKFKLGESSCSMYYLIQAE